MNGQSPARRRAVRQELSAPQVASGGLDARNQGPRDNKLKLTDVKEMFVQMRGDITEALLDVVRNFGITERFLARSIC